MESVLVVNLNRLYLAYFFGFISPGLENSKNILHIPSNSSWLSDLSSYFIGIKSLQGKTVSHREENHYIIIFLILIYLLMFMFGPITRHYCKNLKWPNLIHVQLFHSIHHHIKYCHLFRQHYMFTHSLFTVRPMRYAVKCSQHLKKASRPMGYTLMSKIDDQAHGIHHVQICSTSKNDSHTHGICFQWEKVIRPMGYTFTQMRWNALKYFQQKKQSGSCDLCSNTFNI